MGYTEEQEKNIEHLKRKAISIFGGDGVGFTEILLESQRVNIASSLGSQPPPGMCKVVNLYIDPIEGRLKVEYDDVPV